MRIATWNINGVKARMGAMLKWLAEVSPDIVCLQEIKSVDEEFPRLEIEALGYNVETFGQKSWNGVAILSKHRFDEVHARPARRRQRRAVAADRGRVLDRERRHPRLLHLPAQRQSGEDRQIHLQARLDGPADHLRRGPAGARGAVRPARRLQHHPGRDRRDLPREMGRRRAVPARERRALAARCSTWAWSTRSAPSRDEPHYTFWDFKTFGWDRQDGIRIDHLLLSPQAADRLEDVLVHREVRGWEKPRDHVPVEGELRVLAGGRRSASSAANCVCELIGHVDRLLALLGRRDRHVGVEQIVDPARHRPCRRRGGWRRSATSGPRPDWP